MYRYKIATIKKKQERRISSRDIVDAATGELLYEAGKIPNSVIVAITEITDEVSMDTAHYHIVDKYIIEHLSFVLTRVELGVLLQLLVAARSEYNILLKDNGEYYTNLELQNYLGISSKATFYKIINVLIKHGVIRKLIINEGRYNLTAYVFNPFLARHSRVMDSRIVDLFVDVPCVKDYLEDSRIR